jgi:hypothetical protein
MGGDGVPEVHVEDPAPAPLQHKRDRFFRHAAISVRSGSCCKPLARSIHTYLHPLIQLVLLHDEVGRDASQDRMIGPVEPNLDRS